MTDENVGDGIGAVLAKNVEHDGSSYLPQFHCLSPEHPPHLRHTPHRRVVPVIDQWRRLHLGMRRYTCPTLLNSTLIV
uniref:Uncharacterized protein n=1 Tax=Fagus sylvatica TaxID=28930 RepID=A0A2N9F9S5_FAGSY